MIKLQTVLLQKPDDYLGLRLTKKEKELIKKASKSEKISYSSFVRKVLVEYFINQEKENKK